RPQMNSKNFMTTVPFAGMSVTVLGIAVVIGWYAQSTALIQVLPQLAPMQFNTALSFIFCGITLTSMSTKHFFLARWSSLAGTILGTLSLLEYVAGLDFAIDQLFFKSSLRTQVMFPGRMSPLTASCFTFLGSAFGIASWCRDSKKGRTVAT